MTFGLAIAMVYSVYGGARLTALGHQLLADPLAGFVALIISFVGWVATIYAYAYLRRQVADGRVAVERMPVFFAWSMVFISTMTAATVNNNLIMMYVLVEATTLASAVLVSYYWKPESLEAGYKYLLLCSVGITIGLLGCVVIYSAAVPLVGGHNAMLISEIAKVAGQFPPMAVLMASVLVIIGFGSKAGLVPFHAWLPDTYSQAPVPVTALLSGVASKVAIYAVARIVTIFFPGHSALGMFCVILGSAIDGGGNRGRVSADRPETHAGLQQRQPDGIHHSRIRHRFLSRFLRSDLSSAQPWNQQSHAVPVLPAHWRFLSAQRI